MLKETGSEIIVQSQLLIVPSGSLELIPSSRTLSVGKVITRSGLAGLLVSYLSSFAFLREKNIYVQQKWIMTKDGIFFLLKRFNELQFYYSFYRFTTTMLVA